MSLKDKLPIAIGVLTLLGSIWGVVIYIDNRYAHSDSLQVLSQNVKKTDRRLDYKILSDQAESIQERIWKIEDRYQKSPMPDTVLEEYRDLKNKKDATELKLENLEREAK